MYLGILKRTSVRDYLNRKIEQEKINKLINIINLSPTSMNAQEFSAIFITKQSLKTKIAQLNWNQKHIKQAPLLIIFCADFNRVNIACKKENQKCSIEPIEKFTLGTVDAIIAAGMVAATADELGLSTCFIGGIRNYADKISRDLNLKGQCTPVVAMAIGYANKIQPLRPKINKVYQEQYNLDLIKKEINDYDKTMKKYYEEVFHKPTTWSKATVEGMCGKKLDTRKRIKILEKQFLVK